MRLIGVAPLGHVGRHADRTGSSAAGGSVVAITSPATQTVSGRRKADDDHCERAADRLRGCPERPPTSSPPTESKDTKPRHEPLRPSDLRPSWNGFTSREVWRAARVNECPRGDVARARRFGESRHFSGDWPRTRSDDERHDLVNTLRSTRSSPTTSAPPSCSSSILGLQADGTIVRVRLHAPRHIGEPLHPRVLVAIRGRVDPPCCSIVNWERWRASWPTGGSLSRTRDNDPRGAQPWPFLTADLRAEVRTQDAGEMLGWPQRAIRCRRGAYRCGLLPSQSERGGRPCLQQALQRLRGTEGRVFSRRYCLTGAFSVRKLR